jgi:hypothetical protein
MALSDIIQARVPELGKIKIGGLGEERPTRAGGKFRLPRKDDHFTITTLYREDNGKGNLIPDRALMEQLAADGYADDDGKLRQLPIAVLSNDLEEIIQATYCWYVGKRCAARSDGVKLTKFYDGKNWLPKPIETDWKPEFLEKKDDRGNRYLKLHATLSCVISAKTGHWGGVYKMRTTSTISASQLLGSLVELKRLTNGILRGLPLRLVLRPMQVAPDGKVTTVYVVHCELVGTDLQALQNLAAQRAAFELKHAKQVALAQIEYKRLIKNPGEAESIIEAAEIAEEFHPEGQEHEPTDPPPGPDPLLEGIVGTEPAPADVSPTGPANDPTSQDEPIAGPFDDEPPEEPGFELPDEESDEELVARDLFDDIKTRITEVPDVRKLNDIGAEMSKKRDALGVMRFEELHRLYNDRRKELVDGKKAAKASK